MPRVSTIVPTHNRASLLVQTLASALAQTYADHEVVVVDDGSTDDTQAAVAQIADPRVRYVRQERRGLPAASRNTGLRHATGDYVAMLDDDDLWLPRKLEQQVAALAADPDAGLCYGNAYRFEADPVAHDVVPMLGPGEGPSGRVFDRLYGRNFVRNLTVVLRREAVEKVGGFDEDPRLRSSEDYEYWLRVAYQYPFVYVDEPVALYRDAAGSLSKSIAHFESRFSLIEKADRLYADYVAGHPERRARWLGKCHYDLGRALLRAGERQRARSELVRALRLRAEVGVLAAWLLTFAPPVARRALFGLCAFVRR